MSARHMNRLEQALQQKATTFSQTLDEENDFVKLEQEQKKKASTFAHLANDDSDSDEEDERATPSKIETNKKATETSASKPNVSSKKKKKKQSNKSSTKQSEESKTRDDSDALLDELVKAAQMTSQNNNQASSVLESRLAFNASALDADKEVRRKLGKALSSSKSSTAQRKPAVPRGMRMVTPPGVSTVATTSLPRLLVTPDADWFNPPTFASGEGAHMVRMKDDVFTFEANSSYAAAQSHFRELVKTYDPNEIIQMIQTHPFHVDGLLQLADVFASSSQNETAQMMLRRALFTLESWCSPAFRSNIGSGKFRLFLERQSSLDEDEMLSYDQGKDCGLNGAFLRALSTSMKVAGRRDCFETAFNLAKMILSLEPDLDPCFALLFVDYYAIRAKDLDFVLTNHTAEERRFLPSVAFAYAIALFHKTRQTDSTIPRADADKSLKEACELFPKYAESVLKNAARDIPASLKVALDAENEDVDLFERLCDLSFTRHVALWTPELVAWLAESLRTITLLPSARKGTATPKWVTKYARCRLADVSDKIDLIPREELVADEQERRGFVVDDNGDEADEAATAPQRPNVNMQLNNLLLFVQTMLPWARLPPQQGSQEGDRQPGEFDEGDFVDDDGEDVD